MSQQMMVDTAKKVQGAIPSEKGILQRTCRKCGSKDEDTKRGILRRTAVHKFQEAARTNDPRDAKTREFAKSRFEYDFSKVPARAVPAAFDVVLHRGKTTGDAGISYQAPPLATEAGAGVEATAAYNTEGLLIDNAGSGTCDNGGGGSSCNTDTGKHEIDSNDNTCCTKVCTQEHEQTHVTDRNGWGCCKRLSDALKKPGADANDLITKFNAWSRATSPITECHAYSHDVVCADRLAKEKDCSGAGKDTDCCKDILDYKARYGAIAKTTCAGAPKKADPCPF